MNGSPRAVPSRRIKGPVIEEEGQSSMVEPSRTEARSAPPVNWQVESLRLTAFLAPGAPTGERDWWQVVVGEVPEVRTSNPRLGASREQGTFQGGTLTLSVEPQRVDWHLSAQVENPAELSDRLPSIGVLPTAVEAFVPLARRWLEMAPALGRVAYGAVLLQPVVGREEAYALISRQVPGLRLDTPECSDLLYQINRPRISRVLPGLGLNRLSKWGAPQLTLTQVMLSPAGSALSTHPIRVVARLELDINTAADNREILPHADLGALVDELVGLGAEIAREGDIP